MTECAANKLTGVSSRPRLVIFAVAPQPVRPRRRRPLLLLRTRLMAVDQVRLVLSGISAQEERRDPTFRDGRRRRAVAGHDAFPARLLSLSSVLGQSMVRGDWKEVPTRAAFGPGGGPPFSPEPALPPADLHAFETTLSPSSTSNATAACHASPLEQSWSTTSSSHDAFDPSGPPRPTARSPFRAFSKINLSSSTVSHVC